MEEPGEFLIVEDDIVVMLQNFQLGEGEELQFTFFPTGSTFHFQAEQVSGFPSISFPSTTLEGCGSGVNSLGILTQFPENDFPPNVDITCIENTGSCPSNVKVAYPAGIGPGWLLP